MMHHVLLYRLSFAAGYQNLFVILKCSINILMWFELLVDKRNEIYTSRFEGGYTIL